MQCQLTFEQYCINKPRVPGGLLYENEEDAMCGLGFTPKTDNHSKNKV